MRFALVLVAVVAAAGLLRSVASAPARDPAPPVASPPPQCAPTPGDQRVDGALLHVPPRARAPLPLVLAFHGAGGTGDGFANESGLSGTADAHGFAVLYPSAAHGHFWSLNRKMGTRDIDTLRALIPRALAAACGDAKRVYATGVSNGGGFTARVGCELEVAAIAPVAGGYRALDADCAHRTSVLEIHGSSDTVVPYDGTPPDRLGAVQRYLDAWADRNGCGHAVTSHPRRSVTRLRYTDCDAGFAVEHLRLEGTDHGWPGALPPWPRHNPSGLTANEATWRFFADKRSPD